MKKQSKLVLLPEQIAVMEELYSRKEFSDKTRQYEFGVWISPAEWARIKAVPAMSLPV